MSLLGNEAKTATAGANVWTGRVKALGACPPWWQTASVEAVVEVTVQNIGSFVVHVTRSTKSGRLFASAPSTKRDGEWVKTFELAADLKEAVDACALNAAQAMTVQVQVAGADVDDRPF